VAPDSSIPKSCFYLYTAHDGACEPTPSTAFYDVEDESVAKGLCRLFDREYGGDRFAFQYKASNSVSQDDQVLLDEALDCLRLYDDPDPGLYDPPPTKQMLELAQYALRARRWEQLLKERIAVAHDKATLGDGPITEQARSVEHEQSGLNKTLKTDDLLQMPAEDRRNSGLILLMLVAQAYYKILECTVSMASWCSVLDVELNESYLWTVTSLTNLLKNHKDLQDFPSKFEPAFPDIYPMTIRDLEWEDMVAPEAEHFLSTVQQYVHDKGIYDPEEGSSGWVFVELFRPSINTAIERAIAYKQRMRKHYQHLLDTSKSPEIARRQSQEDGSVGTRLDDKDIPEVRPQEGEPSVMTAPQKRFRIALSFPGEHREFVGQVAAHLAASVGRERILYDQYYEAEFARPNLDTYLQEFYHKQSELIAVFLCADYEHKEWCGLEWRAIRDLIKRRHSSIIMPLRFDNTEIPGLFSIDGYISIDGRAADEVAKLILDRLRINTESDVATGTSTTRSEAGIPPQAVTPGNPEEIAAQGMNPLATSDEYEDGTNVTCGTPLFVQVSMTEDWYRPDESKSPAGWKERWGRLRARFEQIVDECRPITCLLIEKRIPAYPEIAHLWDDVLAGRQPIQVGGGLRREPNWLFTQDRLPLFGVFPIRDARGVPMTNSAGEAFGFRFGLSRQFFLYRKGNDLQESRALPGPRLCELARDGMALLYQLPSGVATSVWRNWQFGFCRRAHSDEHLWLDALFELSWQRRPGDVLHTKRHAWLGNVSIELEGQGLFPRLPDMPFFPGSISIPADNGYPVAWRSTLPDVARASVIAIDELLERASDV
jgi:hypothetical protein